MELMAYWRIVRARLWLIILLTIVAFAVSIASSNRSSTSYSGSVKLAVKPQLATFTDSYGEYYQYVSSEYLNDDVGKIIETSSFLTALQDRAARDVGRRPTGEIKVTKAHRILNIDASAGNAQDALLIVQTAAAMLMDPNAVYFNAVSAQNPEVTIADPPSVTNATPASRVGIDLAVRTLLGLIIGVALAFILDYFDDTVRGRTEIEERLGLAVLGEIPRGKRPSHA
jgi:capsular polysaccharide biosynthesis protein